ncbi:MAG TPA: hypothetical protein VGP83_17190 [Pyrinomonadaceae bacterium]|jgi:hypothetical protein|nr:hypothetical protein [Pyrinomonadaceae bacterium]
MATLIRTDGSKIEVFPLDPKEGFTLREIHSFLGCDCIDVVKLADGRLMVCDDDAHCKTPEPPVNGIASALYAQAGGYPGWSILGDVIVATRKEVQ